MMKSILTTIAFLALAVSGSAQTRSVIVNTSGVVQSPTNFWSADAANARIGLGLGTAATNPASAFQPSGTIAISNGGSGATTAGGARTNFGLGALSTNEVGFGNVKMGGVINFIEPTEGEIVFGLYTDTDPVYLNPIHWNDGGVRTALGLGLSVLTNTNTSNFRTAIGLGVTNDVTFGSVTASSIKDSTGTRALDLDNFSLTFGTNYVLEWSATEAQFSKPLTFSGTNTASTTRTNLNLGWSALTNTSTSGFNASLYGSGTNPVLYNTNGEVVSPTNFWQVAPISTFVQVIQPVTNSTNTATNARDLYLYSLAISVTNVTNTIQLPTNGGTFLGDVATVIHEGPTSSVTAVRQIGSGTNIITMNQFQEAVKFIYEAGGWRLADNLSFIEAIYFSGTNAATHAAGSRTNLGLGSTNDVTFKNITISDQTLTLSQGPEDDVFVRNDSGNLELESPVQIIAFSPISFNNSTNAATTRANLGIPLAALTNTNNANFQAAIFNTNSGPTNVGNVNTVNFNTAIHWMEVNVVTNGVTNNFRIPLFK